MTSILNITCESSHESITSHIRFQCSETVNYSMKELSCHCALLNTTLVVVFIVFISLNVFISFIYPFLIFLVWIVQCWLLRSVLLYLQSVWAVSYTHVTTCILIAWNHLDLPFKRQPHIMVKHTQTVRRLLPTNCLSVFNHCMRLALKGLRRRAWIYSYCSVWLQKRYRLPHTKK